MSSYPPSEPNFEKILNFRDVGLAVNQFDKSNILKPSRLYRAARPDDATSSDRALLTKTYKIRTIVDLRSKTEHINAAKKRSDAVAIAQSAAVPSSDSLLATPLKIPDVSYAEINLNGKGFERALFWKLSWGSMTRLIYYMAMGFRVDGIAILGREVMQPRGLVGLGIDTLDYSGAEIKEVFDVLADETTYPVMVHCTQGKDRTGLVILLVLLLCAVDVHAISDDYVKSEPELEPEMAERLKEIKSIGLDESFAGCPPDFVEKLVNHIDTRYGGIQAYLTYIESAILPRRTSSTFCRLQSDRQAS